jgi:tyrosinase
MTPIYGLDVAANSTGDCRYQRHFQTPHCIVRGYTPGNFSRLPSDEFVHLILDRVPEFNRFNEFLEKSIHNPIHVALSGDMNKQEAPNDPIFWFIHAFIDKIWVDWQSRNRTTDLTPAEKNTVLPPFGVTAGDVEDWGNLCYKYQPFSKARSFPPRMM